MKTLGWGNLVATAATHYIVECTQLWCSAATVLQP